VSENYLATDPPPSLDEQRRLADEAVKDFTTVKHLLDDGNVSHLDALRLNNDFRRIGLERPRIVANELARSASRLTLAENALNAVELELVYDQRDDRFELDALLERLPKARRDEARAIFEQTEKTHFELLNRRKKALERIASRAQETHEQVLRHLQVLDDHFGFVRTHIFWVRDEQPINETTLPQARRELSQIGRAVVRTASELSDRSSWERVSVEFLGAAFGMVVLPWPLYRAGRALRRREAPVRTGEPH
jgi:potassium efflux system protein